MKKFRAIVLVLLLGVTPLFGISIHKVSAAGASNHTWTGNAGDGKMSTAGNWSTNEVPDAGDSLMFPKGRTANIQADISSSVQLGGIFLGEGGSGTYDYTIDGNLRATMIVARSSGVADIDAAVFLYPSLGVGLFTAEAGSTLNINSFLAIQNLTTFRITGPGAVNLDTVDITGNFSAVEIKDSKWDSDGGIYFLGTGSDQPATYTIDNADVYVQQDLMRPTDKITVKGTSTLALDSGQNYTAHKISLEEGAVIRADLFDYDEGAPHATTTFSGALELLGNATYSGIMTDLKLTGDISGSGNLTPEAGMSGNIIVQPASGKTNNSKLANGVTKPAMKVTTITDSNQDAEYVEENNTVVINGQRGDVTVYNGGVLKGTGKVGVLRVAAGGTVAPGNSPGCLTAGNTTFEASSTFEVEIAGKTVCTEYDQQKINGTISLGNATLNAKFLNNFKPSAGDAFTVIDNDGTDAVTGTFAGLGEGATFTVDGVVFKITYKGGDGNDVVITVQSVPVSPNTGMHLLAANPLLTLALTTVSAGVLFVLARRYSFVGKK